MDDDLCRRRDKRFVRNGDAEAVVPDESFRGFVHEGGSGTEKLTVRGLGHDVEGQLVTVWRPVVERDLDAAVLRDFELGAGHGRERVPAGKGL